VARSMSGPTAQPEVLCIGECMLLVAPRDPSPIASAPLCTLSSAGAESNVAMHLARLGHRSAWASPIGTDPLGELVLAEVQRAGVDISLVERRQAEPTGVMFKDPAPSGSRALYYRRGSAASTMDPEFLDRVLSTRPMIVHTTGITPALSESCERLVERLLFSRAEDDVLVSFDVNHRPALWGDEAPDKLLRYARASDIVFVGLDEAYRLWETKDAHSVAALIPEPTWLVVKDSDRDAVSFHDGTSTREPARTVEVVEPVGAGDAFAAGWLSGLLRGLDAAERLRLGHAVAAEVLLSTSDQAELPTGAQLADRIGVPFERWSGR
jgi:2-dehydro-3-deoxygluconokinase